MAENQQDPAHHDMADTAEPSSSSAPATCDQLATYFLEDASERLRFQQEFSLAGFKALLLINGGAVIGLLTYAGNAADKAVAQELSWAFGGYIGGLVAAVLAYLIAYAGQALIMWHSSAEALAHMGVQASDKSAQDKRFFRAHVLILLGGLLCVVSLSCFVAGSLSAMGALS